jgi:carbonic anhydrase
MQEPFAIILGCSDSRVPPEILFDQGIGDLFIIRVAGNVLGQSELDSMNFAVKALGSSLIVVLGHENCGAIKAVWKKQADIIPFINKKILPAIDFKDPKCTLACQTKNNIKYIVDQIKKSETFFSEITNNTLKVVGAYYPFISGKVEFLD